MCKLSRMFFYFQAGNNFVTKLKFRTQMDKKHVLAPKRAPVAPFSMKKLPIVSVFRKESVSDGLDAQNLAGSAVSAENQFSEQIFGLV